MATMELLPWRKRRAARQPYPLRRQKQWSERRAKPYPLWRSATRTCLALIVVTSLVDSLKVDMLGLFFIAAAFAALRVSRAHQDRRGGRIRKKRTHRWWVRPWIKRREAAVGANTLYKLRLELQVGASGHVVNKCQKNSERHIPGRYSRLSMVVEKGDCICTLDVMNNSGHSISGWARCKTLCKTLHTAKRVTPLFPSVLSGAKLPLKSAHVVLHWNFLIIYDYFCRLMTGRNTDPWWECPRMFMNSYLTQSGHVFSSETQNSAELYLLTKDWQSSWDISLTVSDTFYFE